MAPVKFIVVIIGSEVRRRQREKPLDKFTKTQNIHKFIILLNLE